MSQINTDKIASNSGGTTALTIADDGGVTASGTVAATSYTGSGASLTGILTGKVLQVVQYTNAPTKYVSYN